PWLSTCSSPVGGLAQRRDRPAAEAAPAPRARLVRVANAVALVAAILFPTLLGGAFVGVARLVRRWTDRPPRLPLATAPPIERVAADLRRLRGDHVGMAARGP